VLWDPVVLSRVRHLHMQARILTDALLMGNHRSRRVGQAVEFADYQEYTPGMDLRGIDWKVWGRTDRYVVRRYETETELPCMIVLDLSGDLGTGDDARDSYPDLGKSKAGYAICLAATLLYWFQRQGEPIGLHIVGGSGLEHRDFPARTSKRHLQLLFTALATARPDGRADLSEALIRAGGRAKRRSWAGVISDGMEEPSQWLPALSAFARRGADLRFCHLFDRQELTLDFERSVLFYSPEGGEALAIDPPGARADFREVVAGYLEEVRRGVVTVGGQYLQVGTDEPMERVFHRIVVGDNRPVEAP
jgi:uncharacterized protein (DUF58 family)